MAVVPISSLAALGAAPATGDLLLVIDISDLSMSANGTDKKMTVANLFTSPTFTGLLTGPTGSFNGASTPASGSSTEIGLNAARGYVQAYNRTGAAFLPLDIGGLGIVLKYDGTNPALTVASSGVMTAATELITVASASGLAGFNLPHGTLPSSPVNGDMWTTTAGLFVRINGVTKTVTLT